MRYVPDSINELSLEWLMRELYRISDSIQDETVTSITAAHTVQDKDEILNCSGTFTVTVGNSYSGRRLTIKNSGTGTITLSGTIDGNSTTILSPGDGVSLVSTGSGYIIV